MSTRENQSRRSPEEIESEIHQVRERLDDTLTALEEKLSPQHLINDTFDYIRHGGANDFFANLGKSVKQNPLPATLSGIGLGWLMVSSTKQGHTNHSTSPYSADDHAIGARPLTDPQGTGGTHSNSNRKSQTTKEEAKHMSDSMHTRTGRLREKSNATMDSMTHRAQNAGTQLSSFVHNYPLVAGALGLALGAALGSLLPSTRREDRYMGEMRDRTLDRAARAGNRQAEKAQSKVEEKTQHSHPAGQPGMSTPPPVGTTGISSGTSPDSPTSSNMPSDPTKDGPPVRGG